MRIRIEVAGRVQGVGFRWWTVREANRLGLRGWVRNRPDGSVEVEAEGSADAIRSFERLLGEGPRLAHVEKLTPLPTGDGPLPDPFTVRH